MQGKSFEEALGEKAPTASAELDPATVARHRSFPGNRPSTTILLAQLTPRSLGALIAFYDVVAEGSDNFATRYAVSDACFHEHKPVVMGALVGSGEDGSAQVAADATRWVRIAMFGVPLILASMAGNGWMRGVQDTRRPVLFVLCGLSIGAAGVIGLVHGVGWFPRLGLTGSAVANVVGQSITGALFVTRLIGESRRRGLRRPR